MSKELKPEQVADGIYQIDTRYLDQEGIVSCNLIEDNGQLAFVENNTNYAVPYLLQAVKYLGFAPGDVKYVIVTHIHLDHAGGTGLLMKQAPNAQLVIHARGRKHMIDPEKLIKGVKAIYGEEKYKKLYGEILPVEKERVRAISWSPADNPEPGAHQVTLGNRTLEFIDAPGHAKHHMFVFDHHTRSVFSGDSFGISYPRFTFGEFRLVFPSTSPVQFDPERSLETYQRIMDLHPARVLFTHYGSIENLDKAHAQLKEWIDFSAATVEKRYDEGYREEELYKLLYRDIQGRFEQVIREARGKGLTDEEKDFLFLDTDLNAQGLVDYIKKKKEKGS